MFSGPILGTTNCVLIPPDTYADRLFTNRVTAVPGGTRLKDSNFSAVIAKAKRINHSDAGLWQVPHSQSRLRHRRRAASTAGPGTVQ